MARDTEVGDILMGAFVARRLLAIQVGEGDVVLFGTKSSVYPFTYVDIYTIPVLES